MKYYVMFILMFSLIMSCSNKEKSSKDFVNLANSYINTLIEMSPEFVKKFTISIFFRVPENWRIDYHRIIQRYGFGHHPLIARIDVE